jgi:heme exporter protein B
VKTVSAIFRKDLLLELRTFETVPAMVLLSVATFVIFHFGLDRDTRLFVAEREQGGFDAFLLAPVDRTAMLLAKVAALIVYLVLLEVIAVPVFAVLLDPPHLGPSLPAVALFLALLDIAFAVIGTLVSAIAINTRARDLVGPIVGLPLLIPALIATADGLGPLFGGPHTSSSPQARWLAVLALYDVINALLAYALFDFLVED